MEKRIWHKGPPPHAGWWNASGVQKLNIWRWWDGECWSVACGSGDRLVARRALTPDHRNSVEWTDYWPENARVPRVDPRPRTPVPGTRWRKHADRMGRVFEVLAVTDLAPVLACRPWPEQQVLIHRADISKSLYIGQLRLEAKTLVAQRNASLEPLVRARMMASAPGLVVQLPTLEQLAWAFEKWETAYRTGETLAHEEVAQLSVQEVAAQNAAHLHALLAEVLP